MAALAPDTRTRAWLDELGGASLEGGPSAATVAYLSDGTTAEWDTSEGLPVRRCPDLLTVSWEMGGAEVSCELDLCAHAPVTPADIRAYRASEYSLGDATDDECLQARARAVEVIEREARRFFQPVMRAAFVDRPNCTTRSVPMVDGCLAHDLIEVVRAVGEGGSVAPVRVAAPTALDVSGLPLHGWAECAVTCGMRQTPAEYRDAVLALAAWYLVPKAGPENAVSTSTDAGVVRYVIGGVGGAATSLPEVNALIERHGFRDLLVG